MPIPVPAPVVLVLSRALTDDVEPYCCPCGRSLHCARNGVQAGGDSEIVDERVVGVDVG